MPPRVGHNGRVTQPETPTPAPQNPLVEEAIRKAAVAWVTPDGRPAVAVWCLPKDGSLHVVVGPGEQSAPGLAEAATAQVTLRGDHGGAIVRFPAAVTRLEPGSPEWTAIAPDLAGKRLNAGGTGDEVTERWAAECVLLRLTPDGQPLPLGADSQAAVPRPSTAANAVRKPFRLHRVRRR